MVMITSPNHYHYSSSSYIEYIFKLLLCSFLLLTVVVESVPVLVSLNPKAAFRNGDTYVTVIGDDFVEVPIVALTTENGDIAILQPFQNSLIGTRSTWIFKTPAKVNNGKKRPRSETTYIQITFGSTPNVIFHREQFIFVDPVIHSFNPPQHLVRPNGGKLSIGGDNFRLDITDPQLTVELRSTTHGTQTCPIISYSNTAIECTLPDSIGGNVDSVTIAVRVYNGQEVVTQDEFSYVQANLLSIAPLDHIASTPTQLTLTGNNFFDDILNPFHIKVTLKDASSVNSPLIDCPIIQLVDFQNIICQVPATAVAIDPGKFIHSEVHLSIGTTVAVRGNIQFVQFTPSISRVTPKRALSTGGTTIKVDGIYLSRIDSVDIGQIPCTVTKTAADSFECTSGIKFLVQDIYSFEDTVNVKIDGQIFSSPNTEKLKYYIPHITSIIPVNAINKGTTNVVIKGENLLTIEKIMFGAVEYLPNKLTDTDTEIKVVFDSTKHNALGALNIKVIEKSFESNLLPFTIIEPKIMDFNIKTGYLKKETAIIFMVQNFPPIPSTLLPQPALQDVFQFTFETKPCTKLELVNANDYTQFTCMVPIGDAVGDAKIAFKLYGQDYPTTLVYKYFEPKINSLVQTDKKPKGGGTFTINGEHLDIVDDLTVAGAKVLLSTCVVTGSTSIACPMLPKRPGDYDVILNVQGNQYPSATKLKYEGPQVDNIQPAKWPKLKDATITVNGDFFGDDDTKISVTIGAQACTKIKILEDEKQFTCSRTGSNEVNTYAVTVSVSKGAGPPVEAMDDIKFTSQGLGCLGLPEADKSNPTVEWWLIYKLKGNENDYLYIDSDRQELELKADLAGMKSRPFSPLGATFSQYFDGYHNIIINDQPGSRKKDGTRDDHKAPNGYTGHVKGIVIWEEDAVTGTVSGIHIMHSNPCFPAIRGTDSYYGADRGSLFLGNADFNQHFFCYPFSDLNSIGEYLLKNDAPFNTGDVPDMSQWPAPKKETNWAIYDYLLTPKGWPTRVSVAHPSRTTSQTVNVCNNLIKTTPNLEGTCYWISQPFQIGGRTAKYFMKTSIKKSLKFPNPGSTAAAGLNRFIVVNNKSKTPKFEGVDLWTVIASHFQRKFFVEFFYAIANIQTPVPEELANVGYLQYKPSHAIATTKNNVVTYSRNTVTGRSGEHAKIGYSMYPAYGSDSFNANENMFCVGDSNRHNGQGTRGGGALCFQHPELVYQFNRMTHQYNTKANSKGDAQVPPESVTWACWIKQPISITRNAWANRINVEIKDALNGQHYSKMPPSYIAYDAATGNIDVELSTIRTTVTSANIGSERSVVAAPPRLPNQPDIKTYQADDTHSVHYIAHDDLIATICTYDNELESGFKECNQENALTVIINEPAPPAVAARTIPPARNVVYNQLRGVRTYDLTIHNEFRIIKFISEYRTAANIPNTFPRFTILNNPNLPDESVLKSPSLIIRKSSLLCHEELAYLMLLNYAYVESGASTDPNKVTAFTISDNPPNWANAILLSISKYIYNTLDNTKDASFDACMQIQKNRIRNLATYLEADPIEVPTANVDKIFARTAAATWDLIGTSYRDGKGNRVARPMAANDQVPWTLLLDALIRWNPADNILSLESLYRLKLNAATYQSPLNDQLFINNYLVKKPDPMVIVNTITLVKIPQVFSLFSRGVIQQDTEPTDSFKILEEQYQEPILELLSDRIQDRLAFDSDSIYQLDESSIIEINDALKKWVSIDGENQAIKLLFTQSRSNVDEIQYIEDLNRDTDGVIDLCYNTPSHGGLVIRLCSPKSIIAATKLLENAIVSQSEQSQYVKTFGDLQIYYLPNPTAYQQQTTNTGLAIAVLNSKLCDFKLTTFDEFDDKYSDLYYFTGICSASGPIISSVSPSSGPAIGSRITVNGLRFDQSQTVYVGDKPVTNTIYQDEFMILTDAPPNTGYNHLVWLYNAPTTVQMYTQFRYSYNDPYIDSVDPNTQLDSNGLELLSIMGGNFGDDERNIRVVINSPIENECILDSLVSDSQIQCYVPAGVGSYQSVTVFVKDRSSKLLISTPTYDYESPNISSIIPSSADARDIVIIHGDGFGEYYEHIEPNLYVDEELVEVLNFTNNYIMIKLPQGTGQTTITMDQLGMEMISPFLFDYMPPFISSIQGNINTGGGWLLINGFGWGISQYDIDYISINNTNLLNCSPFNTFVECYVPPGIGNGLVFSGSVSSQLIDSNNVRFSYAPPSIQNVIFGNNDNRLTIQGNNFVPSQSSIPFNPTTTYVMAEYGDSSVGNLTCSSPLYIDQNTITCIPLEQPQYVKKVYVVIGGQQSNLYSMPKPTLSGTLFIDKNFDNTYQAGLDVIEGITGSTVFLVSYPDSHLYFNGELNYTTGSYVINNIEPGLYRVALDLVNNTIFPPLSNFIIDMTYATTKDISLFEIGLNSCIGTLHSPANEYLKLMEGTFNLTKFDDFCPAGSNCKNPIDEFVFPDYCQYQFIGATTFKIIRRDPIYLYLNYFEDPHMKNIDTSQYLTNPNEFSVTIQYYDNEFGYHADTDTLLGDGMIKFLVPKSTDIVVNFNSYNPHLHSVYNNMTFVLIASAVIRYPVFRDLQQSTQYPPVTFWTQSNLQGSSITLPIGKFPLSRYGFQYSVRSFYAPPSLTLVYIYPTEADLSLDLSIPKNGLVNIPYPTIVSLVEVSSAILFAFNTPQNPLVRTNYGPYPHVSFANVYYGYPTSYWLDYTMELICQYVAINATIDCEIPVEYTGTAQLNIRSDNLSIYHVYVLNLLNST